MDDAGRMRFCERLGDLAAIPQGVAHGQPTGRDDLRERTTLQVLHHQVANVVNLADVVEGADVGVVQP